MGEGRLSIAQCWTASPASAHQMPVTPSPSPDDHIAKRPPGENKWLQQVPICVIIFLFVGNCYIWDLHINNTKKKTKAVHNSTTP